MEAVEGYENVSAEPVDLAKLVGVAVYGKF
jgi:hypothetical protein